MSRSSSLPQEIVEEIVRHFSSSKDIETLKTCSLVARCFTYPTQQHLFSHIVIRGPQKGATVFPHVASSAYKLKCLVNMSPHIGSYVRYFEIFDMERQARDCDDWISRDEYLEDCLPLLDHLEAFVVRYQYGSVPGVWEKVSPRLIPALFDVVRLPTLIFVDFLGVPNTIFEYGVGPNIRHLSGVDGRTPHSSSVLFTKHGSMNPVVCSQVNLLQSAALSGNYPLTTTLPWFGRHFDLSALKRLDVELQQSRECKYLPQLLEFCKDSLEILVLDPNMISECVFVHFAQLLSLIQNLHSYLANWESNPTSMTNPHIDLSKLTSLKSFILSIRFDYVDSGGAPWLKALFQNCSSVNHNLKEIVIQVVYFRPISVEDRTDIDVWENFSDVLLSGYYPSLEKVVIQIGCDWLLEDDEETSMEEAAQHLRNANCMAGLRQKEGLELQVYFVRGWWLSKLLSVIVH